MLMKNHIQSETIVPIAKDGKRVLLEIKRRFDTRTISESNPAKIAKKLACFRYPHVELFGASANATRTRIIHTEIAAYAT